MDENTTSMRIHENIVDDQIINRNNNQIKRTGVPKRINNTKITIRYSWENIIEMIQRSISQSTVKLAQKCAAHLKL